MKELKKVAMDLQAFAIGIRRNLHQYPHIRWDEDETLGFLKGLTPDTENVRWTDADGGAWVDVIEDPSYPTVLFRADIDALPIKEETNLPFASSVPGISHACGHDFHAGISMAIMVAAATGKIQMKKNARFAFQRAEENPGHDPRSESGGHALVQSGVLEGISEVHCIHVFANEKAGVFASRPGWMLGCSDRMKVEITCTGGHVALPHVGSNAIDIGVRICQEMEGFGLRYLGPNEPCIIVPAEFHSGTSSNIRPDKATLWFAVRHFQNQFEQDNLQQALASRLKYVVSPYSDATVNTKYVYGHPASFIDRNVYTRVRELLRAADQETKEIEPVFGGDDIAYYLEKIPGCVWMLGANQPGCGGHHTPTFNPTEDIIWRGILWGLLIVTQ